MEISNLDIILRLVLAVVLGGMIGFEREAHNRPAGFRTHILVCVGSALIMIVSAYGFHGFDGDIYRVDPGRIASGVITGIGFLGAGTIIRQKGTIQGLTTAAGIWVVAGIGLAVGVGQYAGAVFATLLVFVSLFALNRLENLNILNRKNSRLWIKSIDSPGLLGKIGMLLGEMNINIKKIDLQPAEFNETYNADVIIMDFMVRTPGYLRQQELIKSLSGVKGILEISWKGEEIDFTGEEEDDPFLSE